MSETQPSDSLQRNETEPPYYHFYPIDTALLGTNQSLPPSSQDDLVLVSPSLSSPSNSYSQGTRINPSNKELSPSTISPSNDNALLGDNSINPSNRLLGESQLLGEIDNDPSNVNATTYPQPQKPFSQTELQSVVTPSRRRQGEGSGYIHWRLSQGKYPQAYYHYELWNEGECLIKSSRYIPKRVLAKVQRMEQQKAPVRKILEVLKVKR